MTDKEFNERNKLGEKVVTRFLKSIDRPPAVIKPCGFETAVTDVKEKLRIIASKDPNDLAIRFRPDFNVTENGQETWYEIKHRNQIERRCYTECLRLADVDPNVPVKVVFADYDGKLVSVDVLDIVWEIPTDDLWVRVRDKDGELTDEMEKSNNPNRFPFRGHWYYPPKDDPKYSGTPFGQINMKLTTHTVLPE